LRMTCRERVLAAFDHVEPDRVPAWCGAMPEFWEKAKRRLALDDEGLRERFGDDFRRVWGKPMDPEPPLPEGVCLRTIFGVEHRGLGCGQPIRHPLRTAGLREIYDYPWPDPSRIDVSGIRAETARWGGRYAILGGEWSPFFHDAVDLLSMERLLIGMFEEPEVVDAIFGLIVDYYHEVSRRTFDAAGDAIDVFFLGNDFGTQTGPVVGEKAFRRFFLPHLRRLIDLGHAYGKKVMLHCCGGFAPLIPAMVEAGLDGLHALQPSCRGMDLRTLKERFGSKLLFNGAIDSHHVLIEGTPESVREATRDTLGILKPGGGYVAGASHDCILPETPVENVVAMFDAIREFGEYGRRG
jgi:uroporphyrinogen decarboxylase